MAEKSCGNPRCTVRQSRGRNFVRPIAEMRNPAFPAPVPTRDAE